MFRNLKLSLKPNKIRIIRKNLQIHFTDSLLSLKNALKIFYLMFSKKIWFQNYIDIQLHFIFYHIY